MIRNAILQFALAKGIGDVTIKKAISFLETSGCSWKELCSSPNLLFSELGLKKEIVQNISTTRAQAQKLAEELTNDGVELLVENDKKYPQYLKKMLGVKSPPLLFAKGNISLLNKHAVGFCGSRKVSQKGVGIAADCAKQLAEKGIIVISGYAAGTDLAAHKSALVNGGETVFVLAEGILRANIKGEVQELLNTDNHVFVSQFMPRLTWNAGNAMKRNGVIIGLSRAMILVESGKTGGTFAAGEEALRVGCPLFVIDFAQPEVSAEANPYFIAQGGHPIRGKNGIPNITKVFDVIQQDVRSGILENPDERNTIEQMKFNL